MTVTIGHARSGCECPFCALAAGADAERQQDILTLVDDPAAPAGRAGWPYLKGLAVAGADLAYRWC
jgi:hypothetical protein